MRILSSFFVQVTYADQLQGVTGDLQVVAANIHGVLVLAEGSVVLALTVDQVARIVVRVAARQLVAHRPLNRLLLVHWSGLPSARNCCDLLVVRRSQRAARAFLRSFADGAGIALDGVLDEQLGVVDALLARAGDLHEAFLGAGIH